MSPLRAVHFTLESRVMDRGASQDSSREIAPRMPAASEGGSHAGREDQRRLRHVRVYVGVLCGLALAALLGWVLSFGVPFGWTAVGAAAVLASVCAVFRRFPVRFGDVTVEVVEIPILITLILAGPLWALVVAVPSMIYRDKLRTAFTAATHVLAFLVAGLAYSSFAEPLLFSAGPQPRLFAGVLAAGLTFHALDDLFAMGILRVKRGTPLLESLREVMLPAVLADLAAVLTVLCASWAFLAYGPLAPLALFAGAALAVVLLHVARGHRERVETLEAKNAELEAELEGALGSPLAFASRLVEAVGNRDGYTARLSAASAVYAADVARELGLERGNVEKLKTAALLMDVGLSSVPDEALLSHPKKLNSVGQMHLREHPIRGERVLSTAVGFGEAARWVRWHHEREDGTGYPDRLRGGWIPLEAKILAACETYASLVLDGPHSPGIPSQEARREMVGMAGVGLDQHVVRAILRALDAEDGNYAAAADGRFAFQDASPGPAAAGRPVPDDRLGPTGTTDRS